MIIIIFLIVVVVIIMIINFSASLLENAVEGYRLLLKNTYWRKILFVHMLKTKLIN